MLEENLEVDPDLLLVKDVAPRLGLTERWVEVLCGRGEFEGARKATDIEELMLRRAGKIKWLSNKGIWLIPRGSVPLTQTAREEALTGDKRGKLVGKGNS